MRFVVLLFGFAGCFMSAGLGVCYFLFDWFIGFANEWGVKGLEEWMSNDPMRTAIFLLICSGLGLIGTLLGFFRCGWQGSLLLAIPLIGPAVFSPISLVGTGLQGFTGLISLFVRPLPITPPEEIDEE